MPQAIVDPSELRRFAQNLKRFSHDVNQQIGALHAQFSSLSQTWRDHERDKFAEQFDQTVLTLRKFLQSSEEQIPYLVRKAEHIEEYLNQR